MDTRSLRTHLFTNQSQFIQISAIFLQPNPSQIHRTKEMFHLQYEDVGRIRLLVDKLYSQCSRRLRPLL